MALIRKKTANKLVGVKTFGSLCDMILNKVIAYGQQSEQVHLSWENYRDLSIKGAERARRAVRDGRASAGVDCEVVAKGGLHFQ